MLSNLPLSPEKWTRKVSGISEDMKVHVEVWSTSMRGENVYSLTATQYWYLERSKMLIVVKLNLNIRWTSHGCQRYFYADRGWSLLVPRSFDVRGI